MFKRIIMLTLFLSWMGGVAQAAPTLSETGFRIDSEVVNQINLDAAHTEFVAFTEQPTTGFNRPRNIRGHKEFIEETWKKYFKDYSLQDVQALKTAPPILVANSFMQFVREVDGSFTAHYVKALFGWKALDLFNPCAPHMLVEDHVESLKYWTERLNKRIIAAAKIYGIPLEKADGNSSELMGIANSFVDETISEFENNGCHFPPYLRDSLIKLVISNALLLNGDRLVGIFQYGNPFLHQYTDPNFAYPDMNNPGDQLGGYGAFLLNKLSFGPN